MQSIVESRQKTIDARRFIPLRCPVCNKMLARVDGDMTGGIELKCPRCSSKERREIFRVIKLPATVS